MKKQITFIVLSFLGLYCNSQITFEKGYYIDNSNRKIDCLINNKDWESNPSSFEYKLTENSTKQTLTIDDVKAFSILDKSKYKRFTVKIDRSSDVIGKISNNSQPVFIEEVLFLKVLVEGKANLYVYNDAGLIRYFYNTDSSHVEQLVYKSYLNASNQISKNNLFRLQIMENLKCQDISFNDIQKIKYNRNDLSALFVKYNECHNAPSIRFDEDQKRDLFHLALKPGLNYSSLKIQNSTIIYKEVDFGGKGGFRIGLEAEYIMPFNNNKWGIFLEPAYQYFQSSATKVSNLTTGEEITANVDYRYIEFLLGIRYYIFLNDKSKLILYASGISDIDFNSSIIIKRDDGLLRENLKIHSNIYYALGMGYKFNNRYTCELRYYKTRDILGNYIIWKGPYENLSIIFGYSFF